MSPSLAAPSRDMVIIEGGTFGMGDTFQENPEAWAQETPVHTVTLATFSLSRYEVTVEQFRAFIETTGYITDAEKEGGASAWVTWDNDTKSSFAPWSAGMNWRRPGFPQSGTDPVVCVSWNDATAYCNWLSRRENLPPAYDSKTGDLLDPAGKPASNVRAVKGYRLPTEAEWEYAAREKGRKVRFGNGKDVARAQEINFYATQGAYPYSEKGHYRRATVPVGSFAPNALGLFDMSGNAWEWCSDCHANYPADNVDNPYVSGGPHRILRGGRWGGNAREMRASARHFESPTLRCNNSGFRIARTAG
jgi:formylglycine-generating enzyme required for sulfatase activity